MKIDMNDVIKIKSTADQVFEYLSNAIIEGKIKPGEQLIEADLCRQLNVSRSPLRECLRMLESEGLIVIHARRGIFVETITKEIESANFCFEQQIFGELIHDDTYDKGIILNFVKVKKR